MTVGDANLALALEPSPEEMPAIDPSLAADPFGDLMTYDAEAAFDGKRKKKKSKAEAAAAHDASIAAAIDATELVDLAGEELPSPELLTASPAARTPTPANASSTSWA